MNISISTDPTHVDLDVRTTRFLANAIENGECRAHGVLCNDMMKWGEK